MEDVTFDVDNDPEMQAAQAGMAAARAQGDTTRFVDRVGAVAGGVKHWWEELPRNITVGVMDAAMNSLDAVSEVSQAADAGARAKDAATREGPGTSAPALPPQNTQEILSPEIRQTLQDLRGRMTKGDTTSDEVTQLIAQYMLPFAAWSKAIGGLKAASLVGSAAKVGVAEALTAGTVLKPTDGRFMDLVQLGRQTEGKFGDALRFIAPDGSAANTFIDYVASQKGDTALEGRFKNVIDNLVGAGVLGTAFYTAGRGLKAGRVALEQFKTPKD